jgi:two-component system heavy metal sensor histidine kinase CusS
MSLKIAVESTLNLLQRHWSRPWSLSVRLGIGFALSAFALLFVAIAVPYFALLNNLDREDDDYLAEKIFTLEAPLQARPIDAAALKADVERESQQHFYPPVAIRVFDANGNMIAETKGMEKTAPRASFPPPVIFRLQKWTGVDYKPHKGIPVYLVAAQIETGASDHRGPVVQIALNEAQERKLLDGYRELLWTVLGVGFLSAAFIGHGIARRGLRPIQQMGREITLIGSSSLDKRVEVTGLPAELSSLGSSFNQMLKRLEDSFTRLSRFSADIAHELRTPINSVRGLVEVSLSRTGPGGERDKLLAASLDECQRLSRLIDNLLFLARAENPQTQIGRQRFDVARELAKIQQFYEALGGESGVVVTANSAQAVEAELDRVLVQRAVGNLVENALAHTPDGGRIGLTAERKDRQVRISVSDTGRGIPAEHLPLIFERFHRVDSSRSKNTGGVGLGLAIVKSIAAMHGGTVVATSQIGVGSCFTLILPDHTA